MSVSRSLRSSLSNPFEQAVVQLPVQFLWERILSSKQHQSPFVQRATSFQDVVIRCVRYAFSQIPARIGRVFFSKAVALPFLRFRLLRHGYFRAPIPWREIQWRGIRGLWICHDESVAPDLVVYYVHGGGFSMGSSYFYLEFLLAWLSLLRSAGFQRPALFALEYTLVPDGVYPHQLLETVTGYEYILSRMEKPSRICVAGDSAGGTLILSLLLYLAQAPERSWQRPGYAALISPWVTLTSDKDQNTSSDYLDAKSLHTYARQYSGSQASAIDPVASPGTCKDRGLWRQSMPLYGMFVSYGAEEVFAPECRGWIALMKMTGLDIISREEVGGIHAWPVATLFLGKSEAERTKGLREIVEVMKAKMGPRSRD